MISATAAISPFTNGAQTEVNNAGTINSSGQMAIGVAALSVGGAGIVSNASYGSLSTLGSNAANQYAQGGSVNVTNSGVITTDGASAFGIVALSAGRESIPAEWLTARESRSRPACPSCRARSPLAAIS